MWCSRTKTKTRSKGAGKGAGKGSRQKIYEVIFTASAVEFIETLQKGYKEKLKEIMEHLGNNPFSYPYKKLEESEYLQNKTW